MMDLNTRIRAAASGLFDLEHRAFARRLGLRNAAEERITHETIGDVLFAIDELAWSDEAEKRRLAIYMIALAWEHASAALKASFREVFVVSLSRLGVAPSTLMIDAGFKESRRYEGFSSYSGELATVLLQLKTEVRIGAVEYQLTEFQKRAFDAIDAHRLTGISAPTSAGKSFAIYLRIVVHALQSHLPVVYIVPTISLVNQVSDDLRSILDAHGLAAWVVANSFAARERAVFVLTQERAIISLERGLKGAALGLLVVDEVQNLERVTSERELRSKILYDFLHEIRDSTNVARIVLSGPRLDNVGTVGSDIFGIESAEERAVESPVANLTYSVEKGRTGFVLHQYRDVLGGRASIKISSSAAIGGIGQSKYTEEFYSYLKHVVTNLGDKSRNLIFAPTAEQARKTALQLPGLSQGARNTAKLKDLSDYFANSIHPMYSLVETVKAGVAFHSGRVPPHARLAVEQAFTDGLLKDVVCTTTLMQGVNLPADVVLVRNPKLYIRKGEGRDGAELSPYEFANLRGRAGRLLRDFVGRTVVLDEGSFRTEGQADLFSDVHKSLRPGYGDLFDRGREEIMAELRDPGSAQSDSSKFIASHVRQTVLRYSGSAKGRLLGVGIDVQEAVLRAVERSLEGLDVDRETMLGNRYWDPFDLQRIKDQLAGGGVERLPDDVWSRSVARDVSRLIDFQAIVSPSYYERYLGGIASEKYSFLLAKSAESWGREIPLRSIIDDRHFSEEVSSKIDDLVSVIYKQVVYGLTALLKPIADLQRSGFALLAAFESGVYHPATRYLMSLGLYRETAVQVKRKILAGVRGDDENLEQIVAARVLAGLGKLDVWTRRQVVSTVVRQISGESNAAS